MSAEPWPDEPAIESAGYAPAPAVLLAEKAAIGSAMYSLDLACELAEVLQPGDLYKPAHQIIWGAILALIEDAEEAETPDPQSVLMLLTRRGETGKMGGGLYLFDMYQAGVNTPKALEHARTAAADAVRRRFWEVAQRAVQVASSPAFDAEAHGDAIRERMEQVLTGAAAEEPVTSGQLYLETIDRLEHPEDTTGYVGLPFIDLERLLIAARPGQLITIGARPSVGKSVLADDVARHAGLRLQTPGILFSLEMRRQEVADRMLAAEAGVLLQHLQARELTEGDWDRIARVQELFDEGELLIDDTPMVGLPYIAARLRGMARRKKPAAYAIIDYLQLMKTPPAQNRELEVSALTRGLKLMARRFNLAIFLLAQLNRGPEQRQDKRPMLSDLRESGSIEQNSDIVILPFREDMYEQESPRAGEADLIVAKHRNGPTATVTVAFQGHYSRFVDMTRDESSRTRSTTPGPSSRKPVPPAPLAQDDGYWSPTRHAEDA